MDASLRGAGLEIGATLLMLWNCGRLAMEGRRGRAFSIYCIFIFNGTCIVSRAHAI